MRKNDGKPYIFSNIKKMKDVINVKKDALHYVFSRKKLKRFENDNFIVVKFNKINEFEDDKILCESCGIEILQGTLCEICYCRGFDFEI